MVLKKCTRKVRREILEYSSKKMSPVKSRETNLMFSQRKNPYCDLLRCKYMNNIKQVTKYWIFKLFLIK